MPVHPFSLSNILLLVITAGLIIYLLFLWRVLKQKTTAEEFTTFKTPVIRFVTSYAAYFVVLSALAAVHFFDVVTMPPRFLIIFLPLVFIVVLLSKAKLNQSMRFLQFLPPVLLIAVQVYRLFVELLFIRFANEKIIPAELSIHGRNYDLWIGVLAVPVAWVFIKRHKLAIKAAIAFNILGLLSLLNIFTITVPSMPSPFRVYDMLYLPTYFPGITIVFLASAAIFFHILSLRQLIGMKSKSGYEKEGAKSARKAVLING